jgi:cysteinyl-tRNA synthetase
MKLMLSNTLSRKKEEFTPIHVGKAGIYACGLTVYGDGHVGNYRTFLFTDILYRVLDFNGYEVKLVMNITDVGHLTGDVDEGEDKMIVAMKREGKGAWEIAEYYTKRFLRDMDRLNILSPHVVPKATEHIQEQIEMVQEIEKNGFAYTISDGVYFDTSKLSDYGKLTGQSLDEKEEGARVAVNPDKKNPSDFALWKLSPKDAQRDMEWDSPWGKGFPGWHIECSAMSEKYLDTPFDIHTGGVDLAPVHHSNEIAQSQAAHGVDPVHIWMHGEFLQIDGGKMSKSLNNVYTIDDIVEKGFDPLACRYFTLNAHYKSLLNFTWESLEASQNALNNLRDAVRAWDEPSDVDEGYIERFTLAVNDDLDMPKALSILHELVNDKKILSSVKSATLLDFDKVFGLQLEDYIAKTLVIPAEVMELLEARKKAREGKDWDGADVIRGKILELGYLVEDGADGQTVKESHE